MSERIKLRLILDVEYKANGETPEDLSLRLKNIVTDAIDTGKISGEVAAEADEYHYAVENVTDLWQDDMVQFSRLIAETEACGGFPLEQLAEEMDLSVDEVCEIIDRAQAYFDKKKSEIRS